MDDITISVKVPAWHNGIFAVDFTGSSNDIKTGNPRLSATITNTVTRKTATFSSYDKEDLEAELSIYMTNSLHEMKRNLFDEIISYGLLVSTQELINSQKSRERFKEQDPLLDLDTLIAKIPAVSLSDNPEPKLEQYISELQIHEKLISYFKNKRATEANAKFKQAHDNWIIEQNAQAKAIENYNKQIDELKSALQLEHEEWEARKKSFYSYRDSANQAIDDLEFDYSENIPDLVVKYFKLLLDASKFPEEIQNENRIEYSKDTKSLIVDFFLPNTTQTPQTGVVFSSSGIPKTKELPATKRKAAYESTIYQIIFRVLHILFSGDTKKHIEAITLNGWVTAIDKAVGKPVTSCIASLHVSRPDFENLDLSCIDPKACFKSLRGVCASDLSTMTAVPPIISISKSDKRFIESRDVIEAVNSGTNLAAMDWEDFEHLIREIFEAEFTLNGGEVKVTQASRDGGVDAIAFDPDPIRGGKIVIQAKRYTNTVGVSAVRDLYGTVLNEGATKGVLVTTSDFGPDSYEFAKGKPLSLLNGSNLLFLLEKHGHKARIDIREAKTIAKNNIQDGN